MKLKCGKDKIGNYDVPWNDINQSKKDVGRLSSVSELHDATQNKIPGFVEGCRYWSNDWDGDPGHAPTVEMYSGFYFMGTPDYYECNYRLVREIN